jgi:hypothetical protein
MEQNGGFVRMFSMDIVMDAGTALFERVLRDVQSADAAAGRAGGATARDLLILLKLAAAGPEISTADLAAELAIPIADVTLGLERCRRVGLVDADKRRVEPDAVLEFFEHGLRFVFPAELLGRGRIVPLDPAAPRAAAADPRLVELLRIADASRGSDRRARNAAVRELAEILRERAFS